MRTFDVSRTTYKVSDIVGWLKTKSLNLSPSFQRRSVWKKGAKSYLIDTVIRGFPMPIIFLRDKGVDLKSMNPQREVVDGQQRIRTLISYIQASLLTDYKPARDDFEVQESHNQDLAGKKFSELPNDHKERLLNYEFSVHVLPSKTDDREVLQIFARMNSTGMKLNPQELRNAEYYGEFKTLAYNLAFTQLFRWRDWGVFDEDAISRMQEVELVSELMMFALEGVRGKTQTAIDSAYAAYDDSLKDKGKLLKRIEFTLDQIDDAFGERLIDLPFRRKALFYPFFVAIYNHVTGGEKLDRKATLRSIKKNEVAALLKAAQSIEGETAPKAVLEAVARRTTHASSRKTLVDYLEKAIDA